MKTILVSLFFSAIAGQIFSQDEVPAVITEGQLTVSATTSQTSTPTYAPKHILAIYIVDSQGKFVKTLLAYAAERRQYLVNWKNVTTVAGSAYNTVDAVTGATKSPHGTRSCTWNGKDRLGASVADGTYTLHMELTDNDGVKHNRASFNFTKGPTAATLTPATTSGFSNISISWNPVNTAVETPKDDAVKVYRNQAGTQLIVEAPGFRYAELFDLNGRLLLTSQLPGFNISILPKGNYTVVVHSRDLSRRSKRILIN
ncbi:MAG: DUF2271 domain-containing protein [Paludibacter sp.]|jgi:hypothetical protein|nr:DUF2271 domain-containing protein [Paludibacter sp.]